MSARLRSSSVGERPRPRLHRTSRAESAAALALDVRCACQFYETKSLLPERVNPVGYNTSEEFKPCVHVQARFKDRNTVADQTSSDVGFPIVSPINVQSASVVSRPQSTAYELPPEFAPEDLITDSSKAISLDGRSVSCANMGARAPTLIKQRDLSTSSLLRKRMSEERQCLQTINKRMSKSTASRDRFITQKDPSHSTILRQKMSNRAPRSFGCASNEMASSAQSFQFQQNRIPDERTFYHDSNDFIRNSNTQITSIPADDMPHRLEMNGRKLEIAAPLSMQSQGNRRIMSEHLPQSSDSYMTTSVETQPDSGIESNFVEDSPKENEFERRLSDQNVSDEEKMHILLKSQEANMLDRNAFEVKPTPKPRIKHSVKSPSPNLVAISDDPSTRSPLKPMYTRQSLQLMKVEDVETIEMPMISAEKVQIQYVAKFDSTLRPQEAQTNEYSYSKIFDNYKSSKPTPTPSINISTPDLGPEYAKQRDPSQSPLLQNRYRGMNTSTPTSQSVMSHEKLLPPAGDFPERRASEINPPNFSSHDEHQSMSQQAIIQSTNSQYMRQKDVRASTIFNRRRRNLSQTSLGQEITMFDINSQPIKVTKTISFERDLAQTQNLDNISPYTDIGVKIAKGVSFEFDKQQHSNQNECNTLEFSNSSANRRPLR